MNDLMDDKQLAAFYANSARRRALAEREFAQRTHGWHFGLAPEAEQWADAYVEAGPGRGLQHPTDPSAWAARMIEQADADGVILKPEPGHIRSAFTNRDSRTEMETAIGFGFHPDTAEALTVHADHAIGYEDIEPAIGGDGAAVLGVLRAVVESFGVVRAFG